MPALLLFLNNKYVRFILLSIVAITAIIIGYVSFVNHIKHKEDIKIQHEQLIMQTHLITSINNNDNLSFDKFTSQEITNNQEQVNTNKEVKEVLKTNSNWATTQIPSQIKDKLNNDFK